MPEPAWQTLGPLEDAAAAWEEHVRRFADTGRWPVILEGSRFDCAPRGGWQAVAERDPAAVLRELWGDPLAHDPAELAPVLEPFGSAPPRPGRGSDPREDDAADVLVSVIDGLDTVALVEVVRPADVLGALGWQGAVNSIQDPALLSAVLRGWEDRYDAVVLGLGFDTLHLAVRQPARGEEALYAAAEHCAFCPDAIHQGAGSIRELAAQLDGSGLWSFWWD